MYTEDAQNEFMSNTCGAEVFHDWRFEDTETESPTWVNSQAPQLGERANHGSCYPSHLCTILISNWARGLQVSAIVTCARCEFSACKFVQACFVEELQHVSIALLQSEVCL